MNIPQSRRIQNATDRELTGPLSSEEEIRELAEEIVRHNPSLTQLLLSLHQQNEKKNPVEGMN